VRRGLDQLLKKEREEEAEEERRTLQPAEVTRHAPFLNQQLGDQRLTKSARRLRAALVRTLHPLEEEAVARNPPETGARADGLLATQKVNSTKGGNKTGGERRTGEGVDADDATLVVELEVRRDERRKELFVRLGAGGADAGRRRFVFPGLQEVIGCLSR
jgi:hypothetical protein